MRESIGQSEINPSYANKQTRIRSKNSLQNIVIKALVASSFAFAQPASVEAGTTIICAKNTTTQCDQSDPNNYLWVLNQRPKDASCSSVSDVSATYPDGSNWTNFFSKTNQGVCQWGTSGNPNFPGITPNFCAIVPDNWVDANIVISHISCQKTPTPAPTETPKPTATETATPTCKPTETPKPTKAPTGTNTPSRTPENTNTPTGTPTVEKTNTPTATPTPNQNTETPIVTPSPTATAEKGTNTPTATRTATSTAENTPTQTPTITVTPHYKTNTPTTTATLFQNTETPIVTSTPKVETATPTATATKLPPGNLPVTGLDNALAPFNMDFLKIFQWDNLLKKIFPDKSRIGLEQKLLSGDNSIPLRREAAQTSELIGLGAAFGGILIAAGLKNRRSRR